jgi:hypothetical protein
LKFWDNGSQGVICCIIPQQHLADKAATEVEVLLALVCVSVIQQLRSGFSVESLMAAAAAGVLFCLTVQNLAALLSMSAQLLITIEFAEVA